MISVKDLRFAYGSHQVLNGLTFDVASHGLTALLGCNGAGKTTLFRCLLGLENCYEGTILLERKELTSYPPSQLAQKIAYIPQSSYPAFQYSVLNMVLMGITHQLRMFSSPGKAETEQAMSALETMHIQHLAQRSFVHLSGGERQLVLIARALAQQAKILLMDEPCASLDFGNQHRVMQTVRDLSRQGYTIIMSTHSPQHVLTYADRLLALSEGRLVCEGAPGEILDAKLMQKLYDIPVKIFDTPMGQVVVPESGE